MPKLRADAKEARRAQILEAALRCFARQGYYATTIQDVVAEAGLSRGGIYLYYPTKESLYLALSQWWSCGLEEAIRRRVTPPLSPKALLRLSIEVIGTHVETEADACRVLIEGWTLSHHLPGLRVPVCEQFERAERRFRDLLAAGVAQGEFRATLAVDRQAMLILATLRGLMVQWHLYPGSIDWQQVAEEIIQGIE
ncbi:MAG TPA: TetR/AcrR family transcriptional regulator [Ktedonobacteraceae bacterium]|nr:TetR/AcrR family transcriptional regulator [Ktedonobacteraceae bacterium]